MKHKLLFLLFLITTQLFSQSKNQSIGFKENKGQIIDQNGKQNNAVKYLLNSNGLNIQLKKNGFSYDIYEVKKIPIVRSATAKTLPYQIPEKEEKEQFNLEYIFHRVDIDFVNSNSKVELITEQKSSDFDNYYNVPNKPEGVLEVHQYRQITYKNIYPNIDVVFTIPEDPQKTVEYNFVIHPKGKISDIQLKFSGAETNLVDNKIQMNVRFGKMEETLPASWIEEKGNRKGIVVGYQKLKKNVYGFRSANFLAGKKVVIDPVPTRLWGTFYGDETGNDAANWYPSDLTTDSLGNAYVSGTTTSQSPSYATSGAHQTSTNHPYVNSITNGILFKFDKNGNRLWGTYYAGTQYVYIYGVKTDSQNNVLITGYTGSETNISTLGSFQPNLNGYSDAFLVKFNSSGVRQWSTYFGGEDSDYATDLDLDNNDNIYIVGKTSSKTHIAINSNFQNQLSNSTNPYTIPTDGFITKFNQNGNLIWSTYVGGNGTDSFSTVAIKDSYLVVAGSSDSTNNMTTPGVFQENLNPTYPGDGYVCKFSLDGARIWGSYYGGSSPMENIESVEIDNEGNIYIGGYTYSSDNIATSGTFEESNDNLYKGLLAKLNIQGQRIWGTYVGDINISSIVFQNNSLYIGGGNMDFRTDYKLTSPCSYKPNRIRTHYGYTGKFSSEGNFIWGTYIGNDNTLNIDLDSDGAIFVSGLSSFNDDIADESSYQSNILGSKNFFLMKFSENLSFTIPEITSNSPICTGKTLDLKASGGTNYIWTGPNGFTSTDQNPTIANALTANSGEYSCLITGTGGCDDTKKINVTIGDNVAPIPNLATLPTITGDCNTAITTIPTATDACAGLINGTTTNPLSYNLPGTYSIVWNYNDGNGNSSTQNQTVIITSQPLPTTDPLQTFCVQQNATLNDIQITGQNIKWYSNLTGGTLVPTTTVLQDNATYYASQTINGCESERVPVKIDIQVTSAPTATANQQFCTGQNATIANIEITGTSIKWYDASTNGSLLTETTTLEDGKTYYVSQTINNCEGPRFGVTISIVNTPSVPSGNSEQSFCKKENKTLNDIQITGQNIKWFDTNFSAAALPNTTVLEDNRIYYASQTIGCESDRVPILVHIYDTSLPTGNNNQQFCIDQLATLENLNITGTALKWYDSATNGNLLSETNLLESRAYYVTQTLNNCESERFAITVKIQDTQIPIADSPQQFCIQKNAKISDIEINGQNLKWYESASASISLSESTPLENGIIYYVSQTISSCESDRIPVTISILEATIGDCINFVDELPFPKFITPNGDGFNDTWTIDSAYLAPNSSIRIFDRYGKFIKELPLNTSWNGTYLGNQQPASDYWFTVTRLNGTEYRGHFSLKR
ncbi:T9SS type B sorting domain-containing protein [Flavobacterium sp. SH_e]|uniref:Ig-like domain-containing protein n=1 Tax=Flavobacterium sp. SH_e TaxID=2983767 RepID=UPI0021E43090|nr:T9SS type B sorting domain-containing protein [Flavobacterium sp. SH_e]MCV2483761.1 T9SS type B sorting domain-containing protein [Flavobacterium sp. SH_e]